MAAPVQCAYCFECIYAELEGRKPPSLARMEELWEQYENGGEDEAAEQLKAEQAGADGTVEDVEPEDKAAAAGGGSRNAPYKPAAINRLLNHSSSSSSSSTPSAASSTPSLSSTTSNSSSRTSLFSLPSAFSRGKKAVAGASEDEKYPMFVTWNEVDRRGRKALRGCIGTFDHWPLEEGLKTYADASAFEDTRFKPIRLEQLPNLSCSLTLLTDFEHISDPMDWTIGTHGLRINFVHQGRRYGATYLPDVAEEQGWTKEETIVSLMRKGGWNGRSSDWKAVKDLVCVRYQGLKASLEYSEWQEWRSWVLETGRDGDGLDL